MGGRQTTNIGPGKEQASCAATLLGAPRAMTSMPFAGPPKIGDFWNVNASVRHLSYDEQPWIFMDIARSFKEDIKPSGTRQGWCEITK